MAILLGRAENAPNAQPIVSSRASLARWTTSSDNASNRRPVANWVKTSLRLTGLFPWICANAEKDVRLLEMPKLVAVWTKLRRVTRGVNRCTSDVLFIEPARLTPRATH